jgi:hypothetical protein
MRKCYTISSVTPTWVLISKHPHPRVLLLTLQEKNMAMENPPFVDACPKFSEYSIHSDWISHVVFHSFPIEDP